MLEFHPKIHVFRVPEFRNPFSSILVGNFLSNIKGKVQNNVMEWANQLLSIIMEMATQFFEDSLKEWK